MPAMVCLCGGQYSQPSALVVFPQWSRVSCGLFEAADVALGSSIVPRLSQMSRLPCLWLSGYIGAVFALRCLCIHVRTSGPLASRHLVMHGLHRGQLFWTWTYVEHLAPCRCAHIVAVLWLALSLVGGGELEGVILAASANREGRARLHVLFVSS